tara:strand:+ start:2004 stop:2384 length:381 start_codon:yes stop_codon:yes gene_type:complete
MSNVENTTFFVSESISEKIDMTQFYDHPDPSAIQAIITVKDIEISGKIISFKFDNTWNPCIKIKFLSEFEDISYIMFEKSVDKLLFISSHDNKKIKSFSNIDMISQKFDIDYASNMCMYEFIFEIN